LLLVGLVAARSGLERRRTQIWLAGGGSVAAIVGYGSALVLPGVTAEAHSASTAEILGSGGTALAILGLILLATNAGRFGTAAQIALWPLGAAGALALTVYTAQILVLAMAAGARNTGGPDYPGWPLLIGLAVFSLVGASLWRYALGKGPLERLLGVLAGKR
ncbi:MAG: DUF418 domain-containing protein, partial [Mycetocola sp.]